MRWLVDAMNVIGTRPDGWWKDREAAIARLVEQVERWAAEGDDQVTVVLERPPSTEISAERIEIASAPAPGPNAADREIVRLLEEEVDPAGATVVTSDRHLADQVRALGAGVEPASSFRRELDAA
jgi:uncharacterized protein YaiI (UPF0178 family)